MAQTALRRGSQEEGNSDYFTGCPIGGGFIWYGLPDKIPSNCRICNNSTLAISSFAKLYENLDGAWGESGANMNLPDLRGRFPRGVDGGAGNDPDIAGRTGPNTGQNIGDAVGSVQGDNSKNHTHGLNSGFGMHSHTGTGDYAMRQKSTTAWTPNLQQGADSGGLAGTQTVGMELGGTTDSTVSQSADSSESRPKNANVYFVIRVE
jgi:microcystin-dependent protein